MTLAVRLSYWPASLCSQAGRYGNPVPESNIISPSHGLRILPQAAFHFVWRVVIETEHKPVHFLAYSFPKKSLDFVRQLVCCMLFGTCVHSSPTLGWHVICILVFGNTKRTAFLNKRNKNFNKILLYSSSLYSNEAS